MQMQTAYSVKHSRRWPRQCCSFLSLIRWVDKSIVLLPFGIEYVPQLKAFDTVFLMGVFYHRRSPIDHLIELRDCCRSGGELVLETLTIDGKAGEALFQTIDTHRRGISGFCQQYQH